MVDRSARDEAIAAFTAMAMCLGRGWHLLPLAIPFGVISILISAYRRTREPEPGPREVACMPFDSLSQMRRLRRQVPDFRKAPYRSEVGREDRRIRSRAEEVAIHAQSQPCYEIYHSTPEHHPEGKWIFDICIPLRA